MDGKRKAGDSFASLSTRLFHLAATSQSTTPSSPAHQMEQPILCLDNGAHSIKTIWSNAPASEPPA